MNDRLEKIHGLHACLAVFRERPDAIERVFLLEARVQDMSELLRYRAERKLSYHVVEEDELRKVSGVVHHEGVCLHVETTPPPDFDDLLAHLDETEGPLRLLYLDGVDNPHNLGAILRSAAHFGVTAVLGARGKLPRLGPAATRVAEGGAEALPVIHIARPAAVLEALAERGFARLATDVRTGDSLFEKPLPERVVFLLGAEREGLSRSLRRVADRTLIIPGSGAVESLNVSTATAVFLAEHARQHPGTS